MTDSISTDDLAFRDGEDHPVTIIEPKSNRFLPDLKELWRFRNLYLALVWRNLRVRYRNTALGAVWILLQPLLRMIVYTIVFGLWARIPVGDVPYSIHVLSGIVLVFFLSNVISESANVVRANQALTRKVYFPKLVLPCMVLTSALVDLAAAMVLLFLIMTIQSVWPEITVVMAPILLLLIIGLAFALSLWFSALGIRFRDVTQIMPIVIMLIMYMSPIIYPITVVPESLLPIYALNPMVGIVTGFRWSVLGIEPFYPWMLAVSAAEILIIGITGLIYFVRTERNFNDFL